MLLFKAEKEAFENELIQLNEFEDDKLRMNELLNKQTALMLETENTRGKNLELRQDNKILKKEISDLKQDLINANLIISDQRDGLLDQNLEIKNLEIFCNNQQKEIENLSQKLKFEPINNVDQNMSKSWVEQVLDEYYENDSDNQSNTDHDLSFESISSNSLTENETEKNIPSLGDHNYILESENEEMSENAFYNSNFKIRKFTGNEHFIPTLDPIKVKLKSKVSNILCKYFLKNMCNRGDDCPYLHPFHPEEEFPYNPDILPSSNNQLKNIFNLNQKTPNRNHHFDHKNHTLNQKEFNSTNHRGVVKKSSSTPNQWHPRNPPTSRSKNEIPNPYMRSYPNSPTKFQPYPEDREYHSYGRNTWNPEKNEPCYYYLKGVCRYGSGCYFYHPQPNNSELNSPSHYY